MRLKVVSDRFSSKVCFGEFDMHIFYSFDFAEVCNAKFVYIFFFKKTTSTPYVAVAAMLVELVLFS